MNLSTAYTNPATAVPIDVATLSAASKFIDIAAYCMVEPDILAVLLAASRLPIPIRLYLDRTELESEARGDPMLSHSPLHALLNVPAITIKVKESSILMHLKSYLVDGVTLRTGSANFSIPGETEQDNDILITDDPTACLRFQTKFDAMWARPSNLTVAETVQRHVRMGITANTL